MEVDETERRWKKSTLKDEVMTECIRQSMMTVSFKPPPHGGWSTVTYLPIRSFSLRVKPAAMTSDVRVRACSFESPLSPARYSG